MTQVSNHSTNLNTFFWEIIFMCHHLWQAIPTKRCEADIYIHDSTVNRTESSSHRRQKCNLLKLKAKFRLSYIHGGYTCYVSYQKETCLHIMLLLFFWAGEEIRCRKRGYNKVVMFWHKWKDTCKDLEKHMLTHFKNAHLFSNTSAELISEFRNAPESWNNDPMVESLRNKTSEKIIIFNSCRKIMKTR